MAAAEKASRSRDRLVSPVLYRTYRPASFDDVRGQDHVVSVLQSAARKKNIGHAYLFSGGRGTGKTTVARIFAREIGCSEKDLVEIDAASTRGIDDIRELREGVYMAPFESPVKVYIIDEVHMLTREAFNAFLKVLEEPPAHVAFILATTELHKVPDTIRSRCDTYTFKQPTRALLAETVTHVAAQEGYTIDPAAADLVALLAEGSFRDALGILQKVLTVSKKKKVAIDEVESVTGAPASGSIDTLVEAIAAGDAQAALGVVARAAEHLVDVRILLKLLIERVRALLLLRHAPDVAERIVEEYTDDTRATLERIARDPDARISSATLRALLSAHIEMSYAAVPHLPLEVALLDMLSEDDSSASAEEHASSV